MKKHTAFPDSLAEFLTSAFILVINLTVVFVLMSDSGISTAKIIFFFGFGMFFLLFIIFYLFFGLKYGKVYFDVYGIHIEYPLKPKKKRKDFMAWNDCKEILFFLKWYPRSNLRLMIAFSKTHIILPKRKIEQNAIVIEYSRKAFQDILQYVDKEKIINLHDFKRRKPKDYAAFFGKE